MSSVTVRLIGKIKQIFFMKNANDTSKKTNSSNFLNSLLSRFTQSPEVYPIKFYMRKKARRSSYTLLVK